jgi:hypothetical protein
MEAIDWIEEAVKQTKEKYRVERAREEELVQEETTRRKLSNQFCRELFAWIETIDVRFNHKYGSHVLSANVIGPEGSRSAQILARPVRSQERIAELSYQEDINSLSLSMCSGGASAIQTITLVCSADGEMIAEIEGERYLPEQLGQKIIMDLLDIDLICTVSQPHFSDLQPELCSSF